MAGAGAGVQAHFQDVVDLTASDDDTKLTWKPTKNFDKILANNVTYYPTEDGTYRPHVSGAYTPDDKRHGIGNLSRLNFTVLKYMLQFLGFPYHVVLSTTSHGARRYLRMDSFIHIHIPAIARVFPQDTLPATCMKETTTQVAGRVSWSCMKMTANEFKFVTEAIPLPPSAKSKCRNPRHAVHDTVTHVEYPMARVGAFAKDIKASIAEKKEDIPHPTLMGLIGRFAVLLPDRDTYNGKKGVTAMRRIEQYMMRRKEAEKTAKQKHLEKRTKKLENTKRRFSATKYPAWSEDDRDRHVRFHMDTWDRREARKTKGANLSHIADLDALEKAQVVAAVQGLIASGMAKRQKIK